MCCHIESNLVEHLKKLEGEAAWGVLNLKTGQSVLHNNRRFLAASTIKIPILALYAQQRFAHRWEHAEYMYQTKDFVPDSPYFESLIEGTSVDWDTLAEWMMIRSDNLATNLLIKALGIEAIQTWIDQLGCVETRLQRKMMDLEARKRGRENWTSPKDMLHLMQLMATGKLISPKADQWMLDILYRSEDLEKIPFYFRAPIRVANKPGELSGTRSDVAYIHDHEHQVVMALFCDQLVDLAAEEAADDWLAKLAQILWRQFIRV